MEEEEETVALCSDPWTWRLKSSSTWQQLSDQKGQIKRCDPSWIAFILFSALCWCCRRPMQPYWQLGSAAHKQIKAIKELWDKLVFTNDFGACFYAKSIKGGKKDIPVCAICQGFSDCVGQIVEEATASSLCGAEGAWHESGWEELLHSWLEWPFFLSLAYQS